MSEIFKHSDIIVIIGSNNTGKTTLANTITKNHTHKSCYIDWLKMSTLEIENIYYNNKAYKTNIIIDNYVELKTKSRLINLFKSCYNFTIIFIMNHISISMLKYADILFFAKSTYPPYIDNLYNRLKQIDAKLSISKNNLMADMNKLKSYGFLFFNKNNKTTKKEIMLN